MPAAIENRVESSRKSGAGLRCRQIRDDDRLAVATLLGDGFKCDRAFWLDALAKLSKRESPAGLPRYGYMLECDGEAVGVLLLIFTAVEGARTVRCSVSSWYVKPHYRPYASMLVGCALRHKGVTYVNLTPAPMTVPILKAQGYTELCSGRHVSVPLLRKAIRGAHIERVKADSPRRSGISEYEDRLLKAHAAFGCISLVCSTGAGEHPFVFSRRKVAGIFPSALLIYCRNLDDFAFCAGTLGRWLARRGILFATAHTNGRIAGLPGRYIKTTPTFYFGPEPPPLGNLAFSECAMFGV